MPWKLIATAFGWCAASGEDGDTPFLVVRHPRLRRRFSGIDAWQRAVLFSIRAPEGRAPLFQKEPRP